MQDNLILFLMQISSDILNVFKYFFWPLYVELHKLMSENEKSV